MNAPSVFNKDYILLIFLKEALLLELLLPVELIPAHSEANEKWSHLPVKYSSVILGYEIQQMQFNPPQQQQQHNIRSRVLARLNLLQFWMATTDLFHSH